MKRGQISNSNLNQYVQDKSDKDINSKHNWPCSQVPYLNKAIVVGAHNTEHTAKMNSKYP